MLVVLDVDSRGKITGEVSLFDMIHRRVLSTSRLLQFHNAVEPGNNPEMWPPSAALFTRLRGRWRSSRTTR